MEASLSSNHTSHGSPNNASMDAGVKFGIFSSMLVPNVMVIVLFSRLCYGSDLYNFVSDMSVWGDCALLCSLLLPILLYIVGWDRFSYSGKSVSSLVVLSLVLVGTIFKGRKYPWAPMLCVMLLAPAMIFGMRFRFQGVCQIEFYRWAGNVAVAMALLQLLGVVYQVSALNEPWTTDTKLKLVADSQPIYDNVYSQMPLNYHRHCSSKTSDLSQYDFVQKDDIAQACKTANTVWFLIWTCPIFALSFDMIAAVFFFLQACFSAQGMTDCDGASVRLRLEKVLKRFVLLLASCLGGMYMSAAISGASLSLGSMCMAFFMSGLVLTAMFTMLELPDASTVTVEYIRSSTMVDLLLKAWENEFAKAIALGPMILFIPFYFLINRLKSKYHGFAHPYHGMAERLHKSMMRWNVAGILVKILILGEVFFLFQVGVSKATFVFLSALNTWLGRVFADQLGAVVVLVALIGFVMFMLPPVPGIPVYVFAGVVIAAQGDRNPRVGFWGGCAIAVAVGFVTKLLASSGQYGIGYLAGQRVKVQQLIGVDKVPCRAVEKIVSVPGFSVPKVSILVGGPDWPTSVTCGILRVNLLQMLIGTCPVLVCIIPSVLMGAFLVKVDPTEDTIFNMLSSGAATMTIVLQGIPQVLAAYYILVTIERHHVALSEPRSEHEAVAELTRQERAYTEAYVEALAWERLEARYWLPLCTGVACTVASGYLFIGLDELCFRPFSIGTAIGTEISKGGLGGDPLAIVLPVAAIPLTLFCASVVLHIVFNELADRKALRHLTQLTTEGTYPAEAPASPSSAQACGQCEGTGNCRGTRCLECFGKGKRPSDKFSQVAPLAPAETEPCDPRSAWESPNQSSRTES